MSRRRQAERRVIKPDPKYGSPLIARFVNKVMLNGKKSLARTIVYKTLENLGKQIGEDVDPVRAFEKALENAMPRLEVKSRRVGGSTLQVPVEVRPERRATMAMDWIISFARKKPGQSMVEGLSAELFDCHEDRGTTIKKKEDTHRMAEANKAFAHYKW